MAILRRHIAIQGHPATRPPTHSVHSQLLEIARHKVVRAARRADIACKQTCAKEGKTLRRKTGGCAHTKQFERLRKTVKRQRTILGAVMRELQRKLGADQAAVATGDAPGDRAADRLCEV